MSASRIVLCTLLALALPARAANHEQIESALQRARAFLLSQQNRDGTWEFDPPPKVQTAKNADSTGGGQYGGPTALVTYALLAAGENPQSPQMKSAIDFLLKVNTPGIYAVGLRAQVWNSIPMTDAVHRALTRDGEILKRSMKSAGDARGLFFYAAGADAEYDHSVSQFGILGMWACVQAGYECPTSFWTEADTAWRKHQGPAGGWSYFGVGEAATHSMTAAGVATLFITQDYLRAAQATDCRGNLEDRNIEAGLKWMGDHLDAAIHEQSPWPGYTMFGIERIGVAAGRKYFGTVNWFDAGAQHLVSTQNPGGGWGRRNEPDPIATAFYTLFLARGRAPVIMNKLAYDAPAPPGPRTKTVPPTPGNWNQRPRDVANLARWIGRQTERDLNWQITNLHGPVDELHDAPILYVAGNQALAFAPEDQDKLRQFVEEGGLILGNADCGNPNFANAFVKLGESLFPGRKFTDLPADHPIYMREQFPRDRWKSKLVVRRLSNGTRELMLLIPAADPSRFWETQAYLNNKEAFELAADIFLYAVDKANLRWRGDRVVVHPSPTTKPTHATKLARLQYAGNWDPEPGGWRRLAAILHNQFDVELTVDPVPLGKGQLTPRAYPLAHLTGTTALTLDDAAKAELVAYVNAGGTLIVDAAGGSADFAGSVEALIAAAFPAAARVAASPLPPSHPLFAAATGAPTEADFRPFAKRYVGNTRSPRIRALELNHRLAVFVSPEDLSTGLVGQAVDGINGYTPACATELMTDVVLFTTGNARKATTAPATRPS